MLEGFPEAQVVFAVDPVQPGPLQFRGYDIPCYASLEEAANGPKADTFLIATPTATHAAVGQKVLHTFEDARILVEKPAAATLAEARALLNPSRDDDRVIETVYHFAFAPEVLWGRTIVAARASSWGPLIAIDSWFSDPYSRDLIRAQQAFGNSWLDSGINALSVAQWFTHLGSCRGLVQVGPQESEAYWARIECESAGHPVSMTVLTSWGVSAGSKRTRLTFASGANLVMDHTAVSGIAVSEGKLIGLYDGRPVVSRREAHYRSFYANWLHSKGARVGRHVSLGMHEALLGQQASHG